MINNLITNRCRYHVRKFSTVKAVGDIDGSFKEEETETQAQNYNDGVEPDGRSGILRITQDGQPVGEGILGNSIPLKLYYAYGIRNSFGLDFDPVTGKLWATEKQVTGKFSRTRI
jgi:aldose sugar dehydrogenase